MVTAGLKVSENQRLRRGEEISYRIPKRLFTLKEAAVYLGRGLHGVRDMVWKGEVPVVRSGRKMFVDIADLEAWVSRNKMTYI